MVESHAAAANRHYWRGVTCVLITCLLWGVLPVFLKMALEYFAAGTIVWFRFAFSFAGLFLILWLRGHDPRGIIRRPPPAGVLGGAALAANYFLFLLGIHYSGPANSAILIQTAPALVVVSGVVVFHERLNARQTGGIALAAAGFVLFYREQQGEAADVSLYQAASFYILLAAAAWMLYALAMKRLSGHHGAQRLNVLVYGVAAALFLPAVEWGDFAAAAAVPWLLLIFLGLNTLIAYGTLAEAMRDIPLTHVSVLITLNPLVTMAFGSLLQYLDAGWVAPERISAWGYAGALLGIAGVGLVVRERPKVL